MNRPLAQRFERSLVSFLTGLWYPMVTRIVRNSDLIFMNYGYAASESEKPRLKAEDEPNRLAIQLYHHVLGECQIEGRDVLEVSCGHGGGASYLARYFAPKSVVGVDRNSRAIDLCKRTYAVDGLSFRQSRAEALDFEDASFDVVINVEASHCYRDFDAFIDEVVRVLRPGGWLLFADFRLKHDVERIRHQFQRNELEECGHEVINEKILRALEVAEPHSKQLIHRYFSGTTRWLRRLASQWAGVPGSSFYRGLKAGEFVYFSYRLRKSPRQPDIPR